MKTGSRSLVLVLGGIVVGVAVAAAAGTGLFGWFADRSAENRKEELIAKIESRIRSSKVAAPVDVMGLRLRLELETPPPGELEKTRELLRERVRRRAEPKLVQWELFLQYAGIRVALARRAPPAEAIPDLEPILAAFDSPEERAALLHDVRDSFDVRMENRERERAQAAAILFGLALKEYRKEHGELPEDLSLARPDAVPEAMLGAGWKVRTDEATGRPALYLNDPLHPIFRLGGHE